jgi:hypothetical protein
VAETEGDEARERALAALTSVGTGLAAGERLNGVADRDRDRDLAALAARIDSRIWDRCRAQAGTR